MDASDSLQLRARKRFWAGVWNARMRIRAIGRGVPRLLRPLWTAAWLLALKLAARRSRRRRGGQRLYWGPEPVVSYKYWSDAMRAAGAESTSVASYEMPNFEATRFDLYYDEIVARSKLPGFIAGRAREYVAFLHLVRNFDIAHLPFTGGPLGTTRLASREPGLLRSAGIRTVLIPYGGDFWRYSWVLEAEMRHALLLNYPQPGRHEEEGDTRVRRWMKEADIVVGGLMVDGASRWDVLPTSYVTVPDGHIRPRERWGSADGERDAVAIVHAPNHRGVKGTEFIVEAIEALRRKGRRIEFTLLEKRPNAEVLEAMRTADICIDHCIGSGYGLFAIEAMASGAAVMAKLEDEQRIGVHRHFGWLEQCPLVSANVDQLEETIDHLIREPSLREELGRQGIEYVRRFHSDRTAQYLFGQIHRSLAGEEVDLMRLFHPISSEFMQSFEPLRPPLRRNRPLGLDGAGQ
jgi:glycosyltransferase involved in cell wall biosynthesis